MAAAMGSLGSAGGLGGTLFTPANVAAFIAEAGVVSGSIVSVIGAVRYLPRAARLLFNHGKIVAENISLREINRDLQQSNTDQKIIIDAMLSTQNAWREMYADLSGQVDTLQDQLREMHTQMATMTQRQTEMGVLLASSTEYIVDLTHAAETRAPIPPVPTALREAVEVVRQQRGA